MSDVSNMGQWRTHKSHQHGGWSGVELGRLLLLLQLLVDAVLPLLKTFTDTTLDLKRERKNCQLGSSCSAAVKLTKPRRYVIIFGGTNPGEK